MIIAFKPESPLYIAFKENEKALSSAIRFAATQSALLMGKEFNKVYYRSCSSSVDIENIKKAA